MYVNNVSKQFTIMSEFIKVYDFEVKNFIYYLSFITFVVLSLSLLQRLGYYLTISIVIILFKAL